MSGASHVLRSAGAFVAMLVRVLRWRLAASAALALSLAIAEGTGLLLLVPLLASLGLAVTDGPASGIATLAVRGFGALGLQPSLGACCSCSWESRCSTRASIALTSSTTQPSSSM